MSKNPDPISTFESLALPPVDLEIERRNDGTIVLSNTAALPRLALSVAEATRISAERTPDRVAFAERGSSGDWIEQTCTDHVETANAIAQWLLDQGVTPATPIMVISGNSIAHASIRLAAYTIGCPYVPVSQNYALLGASSDFGRLRYAAELIDPACIFAETAAYLPAAKAVAGNASIISCEAGNDDTIAAYNRVSSTTATAAVDDALKAIDLDQPASFMLTSGSTGKPKAVIHTNKMMTASLAQTWWVIQDTGAYDAPLLEWLPWSHVSGNYVSLATMVYGASCYIDGGKPLPGMFDATIQNLSELPVRTYTNVPAGYGMLAEALSKDEALRDHFFKHIRFLVFGGAALPVPLFNALQGLSMQATGRPVFIMSGYGATETTTGCMATHYPTETVGLGLPLPGMDLKLIPYADRYEVRLRGEAVTPGYHKRPELIESMFDEEGYYRTGDTADFMNKDSISEGISFKGRVAEEFKLDTGTWVAGGELRQDLLKSLAPNVFDLLVCGEGRDRIGILVWLTPSAIQSPNAKTEIKAAIMRFNASNAGSSRKVCRLGVLDTMPDPEAGELSDKGSVNQALAISRRSDLVDRLFGAAAPDDIMVFD